MSSRTTSPLLCPFAFISCTARADQAVHLKGHVPPTTPETATVFLAGSLPLVGTWKPDGLKLTRQPDGTYTADLNIPVGQTLEFKFTRGNWSTVEKNTDGSEEKE